MSLLIAFHLILIANYSIPIKINSVINKIVSPKMLTNEKNCLKEQVYIVDIFLHGDF